MDDAVARDVSLGDASAPATHPGKVASDDACMVAKPSTTPARSPRRPRLLWRGALLLPDGTALPGVAFVSHSVALPFHSASASPATPLGKEEGPNTAASSDNNAAAADADLCLAVEMVRHAPLRIISIVEDSGKVLADGAEEAQKKRGAVGGFSSISRQAEPAARTMKYEASGNIRMYIDPRSHSTLAYFERAFCTNAKLVPDQGARTERVLLLSLETSGMTSRPPFGSISDNANDGGSIFPFHPPIRETGASMQTQVCIFGRMGQQADGAATEPTIEIVVGRRYREKLVRSTTTRSAGTGSAPSEEEDVFGGRPTFGPRPDDPLPRLAARPHKPTLKSTRSALPAPSNTLRPNAGKLRKTASTSSLPHSAALATVPEWEGEIVPTRRSASTLTSGRSAARLGGGIKVGNGSRTPGRRGEKRARLQPQREDMAGRKKVKLEMPQSADGSECHAAGVKRETASCSPSMSPVKPKFKHLRTSSFTHDEASDSFSMPAPLKSDTSRSSVGPSGVETTDQRNRATIKKLVHKALLERGVQRGSEDYAACWGATCSGTAIALRALLAKQLLDKEAAARIVAIHLDMYLPHLASAPNTLLSDTSTDPPPLS